MASPLTDADIRRLAKALVAEIRSGALSAAEIGALGQETQCDDKEMRQSMDPTSTEIDGESLSAEQIANRLLSRSRREPRQNVSRLRQEHRAKAGR